MAFSIYFDIKDRTKWPERGSLWAHRNGNIYKVMLYTNNDGSKPGYPITIVYQNMTNGEYYSRRLDDWHRSMTFRKGPL